MQQPQLSVLLPFRNAAHTLADAVQDTLAQTFRDLELLLIDNGSSDGGTEQALQYAAKDPRVRYVHVPEPGIAHALNAGLAQARGHYIGRMDADDRMLPQRFAEQLSYLHDHPEVDVLATATTFSTTVADARGMETFVRWQNALLTTQEHYLKRFVDAPVAHPTVLFRSELIERYGPYSTEPVPEDHELWLRWMDQGVRFAKLPQALVTWNDHGARASRTHPHYSPAAFWQVKAKWFLAWYLRKYGVARPVIIAGTSTENRQRAEQLAAAGLPVIGFTDVRPRVLVGQRFIPHDALPPPQEVFVLSLVGQQGTGERINAFLTARGGVEGEDHLLAG